LLTTDAKRLTGTGTIVAVGDKVSKLNVNDRVLFNSRAQNNLTIEEGSFLMFPEDDVYGVLTNDKPITGIKNFKVVHNNDLIVKVKTVSKEVVHASGIVLTAQASAVLDRPTKGTVEMLADNIKVLEVNDLIEFEVTAGIDLSKDEDEEGSHYVLMNIDRVVGKYTK
jgi:hypothetical protein